MKNKKQPRNIPTINSVDSVILQNSTNIILLQNNSNVPEQQLAQINKTFQQAITHFGPLATISTPVNKMDWQEFLDIYIDGTITEIDNYLKNPSFNLIDAQKDVKNIIAKISNNMNCLDNFSKIVSINREKKIAFFNGSRLFKKTLYKSFQVRINKLITLWIQSKNDLGKYIEDLEKIKIDGLQEDFVSIRNIFSQFKTEIELDICWSSKSDEVNIDERIVEDIETGKTIIHKINDIVFVMVKKLQFQLALVDNNYMIERVYDKLLISTLLSEAQVQVVNLNKIVTTNLFKTVMFEPLKISLKSKVDIFSFFGNDIAIEMINLYKDSTPKKWQEYKVKMLRFEAGLTEFYGSVVWQINGNQLFYENQYNISHSKLAAPVIFRFQNENATVLPLQQHLKVDSLANGSDSYVSSNHWDNLVVGVALGGVGVLAVAMLYYGYKKLACSKKETEKFEDINKAELDPLSIATTSNNSEVQKKESHSCSLL